MSLIIKSFFRRKPLIILKSASGSFRNFCAESPAENPATNDKKGLVIGLYEPENPEADPVFTAATSKYNDKLGGKLLTIIRDLGLKNLTHGKSYVFNNIDPDFSAVAVVGLGKEKQGYNELEAIDQGRESARAGAALGVQKLHDHKIGHIFVEGLGYPEQAAEGSALAAWRYQENKNKAHWSVVPTLELFDDPDHDAWQRGIFKAEAQNLARRLSDTPANQMTPTIFAQQAVNALCPCGIKVEVHDKDWIETKKMQLFLTVARGSCEPPIFLEASYCGGPSDQKPIVIIGKGITFDAGGICLKDPHGMERYRADMAGASSVIATVRACSALSLPVNVVGVVPLCENMPSGMAMKPGDVVTALNGKTVEIQDTDNEGRLILADALVYSQLVHKPRLIIDVATLTPGVRKALGSAASAVFSNSETMWRQVRKAGILTGDRVWRMPLWKFYKRKVTDFTSVDVNNKGHGKGDTCLGAAFLNEFITCIDWLHFDITGVGMMQENKIVPYYTNGRMTGRPTRTLIQFIYQLSCPQEKE